MVTPNRKRHLVDGLLPSATFRRRCRRKFLYDTNVGAGLPVIENLQNLLNAGDELQKGTGILFRNKLSFIFGKAGRG